MCGRFVSARKRLELLEEFAVERDRAGADRNPDYNVAPTKQIYAVLDRPGDGDQPATSGTAPDASVSRQQRELRLLRWGLVPSWAKEASGGARMINARAETVASKPAFRSAFSRRRCLIPADGYYEWQPGAAGSKVKQPFYIYRTDGGILAFAGIYELWRDESVPADHDSAWLWTAAIITTDAPDEIGRIHDRMPMVIARDRWADWLDPANNDKEVLRATLLPAASPATPGGLTSHHVSTAVNSVRNNGPELIEPVTADGGSGPVRSGSAGAQRPSLF